MFPPHIGMAGVCDGPVPRLPLPFTKPQHHPCPRPSFRHPQPAHAHRGDFRHALSVYGLPGASSPSQRAPPMNPTGGAVPLLSIAASGGSNTSTAVAMPTPLFPYPGIPFPAGFPLAGHSQELQQLSLLQSLQRGAAHTVHPSTSGEQHKIKTPINRNYLELAMLVCNTFRGKLFPCPHCRYVTDRRNNLKRHISTMHQTCDKTLECCGVSFSTKASLREHIMIFHHNGYSCPYCGRRFCRKALLKRHLSVHSGQKDYTCPNCDYATSHKSNLERHKRIHERLKLGEDGSMFECGDFTTHTLNQSPDTTDNSGLDSSKDDSLIDIESEDESSDVDVTDDTVSDSEKMRSYPIILPSPKKVNEHKDGNVTKSAQGDLNNSGQSENKIHSAFNSGLFSHMWHLGENSHHKRLQSFAIDFSKSHSLSSNAKSICATVSSSVSQCDTDPEEEVLAASTIEHPKLDKKSHE